MAIDISIIEIIKVNKNTLYFLGKDREEIIFINYDSKELARENFKKAVGMKK